MFDPETGAAHVGSPIARISRGWVPRVYAYVQTAASSSALTIRLPAEARLLVGERVGLTFPPERLHVFDAAGIALPLVA